MSTPTTLTVVLRPAHGGEVPGSGVTTADLAEHAPDPDAAQHVQSWFAGQGLEVGPIVGCSFAITAPADQLRTVLHDVPAEGAASLDALPAAIAEHVSAVVAEPPLDFGPTSY